MIFKETETTELKRILNDTFEKALVAFLNTMDGTVYIGVEDDGTVVGVANIDETQKRIADILTTQILPNPQEFVELGTKYVDGKNVVEVKVHKGNALYYIKKYGRSAQGCYVRIGTSCRSMTEEQIEKEFRRHIHKPEITDIESHRQDLTFEQFKFLLKFRGVNINEAAFVQNFHLLTVTGKYNLMAYLLSDQNDTSIKVVKFRGKTKADFISRKEFGGCCIIKAMIDALEYSLNVLNIVQTNIVGIERIDTPYFDEAAFREAWINAVCHNNWIDGTPPAVYGFSDRVEIISHGLLREDMNVDEFYSGVSKPVNKALAQILTQMRYIEQSGKGVPTVVNKYGRDCYQFGTSFIECIIPYNILDQEKADEMNGNNEPQVHSKVHSKVHSNITDAQQKVLNVIAISPSITTKAISMKLEISPRMVAKHLKALKDAGIIRRVGSDKTGHWEIIE